MRHFSVLIIFALFLGGAVMLYEKESRKVKGVLSQLADLQAQLGDLQAEVNQLKAELEAVRLAQRRQPNLKSLAAGDHKRQSRPRTPSSVSQRTETRRAGKLIASDVTTAPPVIRARKETGDDDWNRPTVDAEQYQPADSEEQLLDPYQ